MKNIFESAFEFIMEEEGKSLYTNDPRDPGGPTKFGVSLNYNKKSIPDKDNNNIIDENDVKLLVESDALEIFKKNYWDLYKCNELPDALSFMYADMIFNPGVGAATKCLQKSLNYIEGLNLVTDGIMGSKTIKASLNCNLYKVLPELAAQREIYYTGRPNKDVYLLGWTRRTMRCLCKAIEILKEKN